MPASGNVNIVTENIQAMRHKVFFVAKPWISNAANRAIVKYPAHNKTAAAGKATKDSRIHSSSKAKAIRYAI
jgi:hypothetical protein